MVKKRRRHTASFKFRVTPEALEDSKTISQLSSEHEIYANQIGAWKRQLLDDGPRVFASNGEQVAQEAELYEQIGRFKMELEWLKKKLPTSVRERPASKSQLPHAGGRALRALITAERIRLDPPYFSRSFIQMSEL